MNFLQVGFFLLLMLRLLLAATRWRTGKLTTIGSDGQQFSVRIARDKARRVRRVSISLDMADHFRFRLRRETRFDRIARNFGVAREWQTGDQDFDPRVFIVSEDWAFNEALSAKRDLRQMCTQLMGRKPSAQIECKSGRLYLDTFPSGSLDRSDQTVAAGVVAEWGTPLRGLRDALQRITAEHWEAARDPSLRRKSWLVGICVSLGLLGVVALFVGGDGRHHQVVHEAISRHAIWSTTAVMSALLAGVFFWLRASPHTHAVLLDLLLLALPGSFLAGYAGSTLYNERCDQAETRLVPVQVVQTYVRTSKSSRSYFLEVAAWPDPHGDRDAPIDSSDYAWIRPGSCITAEWHRGALGDGWVSGYRQGCVSDGEGER